MTMTRRNAVTAIAGLAAYTPALSLQSAQTAAAPSGKEDLLADLVAANRFLSAKEIVDGYGHISVRDPANPNQYLMARDLAPALVTAADILTYDLNSNPLNANGAAVVNERFIHGEIYKVRPDVKAVVHAHAAELIPFSVMNIDLRPICHMGAFIGAGVPVFEIRTARDSADKSMLIHTGPLGKALAAKLADHPAVLIRGHGAAVAGSSLGQVVGRSVYLQENAAIQFKAVQFSSINAGYRIEYLNADEARNMQDNTYYRDWDAWRIQYKA